MRSVKVIIIRVVVALTIVTTISGLYVLDYKIYKAKYPNTTFWMWALDNNNK